MPSLMEYLIPELGQYRNQQRLQETLNQLRSQVVGNQTLQSSLTPGGGSKINFEGAEPQLPVNPVTETALTLLSSQAPEAQQIGLKQIMAMLQGQQQSTQIQEAIAKAKDAKDLFKNTASIPGLFENSANNLRQLEEGNETSLVKNLNAAGLTQGTPEFKSTLLDILKKPEVQINQGDKPLSISDLKQLRTQDDQMFPPGTTLAQAKLANAKVIDKPSAEEAKQAGQRELGFGMLDEMEALLNGNHPEFPGESVDISPGQGALARSRAGVGLLGELGSLVTPGQLSKAEAKMLSLATSLSNQIIAAMRGAQVGPQEQKLFERQLPVYGQDPKLFLENIKLTRKNLKKLQEKTQQMRGIIQPKGLPPLPPGSAGVISQ